jgi:hypothetical protein
MADLDQHIKNEKEFCEELGLEKNEHGHFIYVSTNGESSMNLPYILEEYNEWLIKKE